LDSRFLTVKYVPNGDEVLESQHPEITGEDPENGSLSTGTIPMRILTEFSVFDAKTKEMVPFNYLMAPRDSPDLASYCAVGYVLPAMENTVDDAEEILDLDLEDCQCLRLSCIRSMSLFDFDDDQKVLDRCSLRML
jgi:DNA (cytosine-5)-methyltransferase 1